MKMALFLPHLDVAGGLGVHCRTLATALEQTQTTHTLTILAPADSKVLFPTVANEPFTSTNGRIAIRRIDVPKGFNLAQPLDPLLAGPLADLAPDLLYCSYYTGMKRPSCRQIVAFHDAGFLDNPEGFGPTAAIRKATLDDIRDSIDLIQCISFDARDRICKKLPWNPEKTKVVWHALPDSSESIATAIASEPPSRFTKPYFLLPVGAATGFNRKRKNVPTAVNAFRQFKAVDARLVIAGTAELTEKVLTELLPPDEVKSGKIHGTEWSSADGFITIMPTISRPELLQLMRHAAAVVYPSRYEGFGLPTVEAMALGTPLIAAKATSIPEIVREAGLLVDPDDTVGFAKAMLSLLHEADRARELVAAGRQRIHDFTPERLGREMVELFERVR